MQSLFITLWTAIQNGKLMKHLWWDNPKLHGVDADEFLTWLQVDSNGNAECGGPLSLGIFGSLSNMDTANLAPPVVLKDRLLTDSMIPFEDQFSATAMASSSSGEHSYSSNGNGGHTGCVTVLAASAPNLEGFRNNNNNSSNSGSLINNNCTSKSIQTAAGSDGDSNPESPLSDGKICLS